MAVERTVTGGGADIGSRISASTREGDAGGKTARKTTAKKGRRGWSQGDQTTSGSRVSLSTRNFSWRFTITRRLRTDVARGLCDERRAFSQIVYDRNRTCLKLFLAVLDMAGEKQGEKENGVKAGKGHPRSSRHIYAYIYLSLPFVCILAASSV